MTCIRVKVSIWISLFVAMTVLAAGDRAFAVSLQEEIDLGKKLDAQVLKDTPLSSDEAAQREIDRLGQIIVRKGGLSRPQIVYHFRVLKDDDLNAFSTCGGYIYFTDHLWNILRTDERAGVLAHEIVHSDRRHSLDAMLKLQKRSTILGVILILAGANRTVTDIVDMANQLSTLKYSRGDEKQADEIGLQYLHNAGLNPAGLLLALRKIGRFEVGAGQRPPTILANHPQTPDRLHYIEADLVKMGVPVPPENVATKNAADKIGAVTSRTNDVIYFTSSKPLKPGDVVWLMSRGWDYYYETHTTIPMARVVVSSTSRSESSGRMYAANPDKTASIGKGSEVYWLPAPPPASGVGVISVDSVGSVGSVRVLPVGGHSFAKMERLLPVSVIWSEKESLPANEPVGYVVITDPASRTGFMSIDRPKYAYAPTKAGAVLISLDDPNADRWAGAVVSVGVSSKQVEVLPSRPLDPAKTYDVAYPAWEKSDLYKQRIVAIAKFTQSSNKIVMSITQLKPGWSMTSILPGFDIYEQPSQK